MRPPSAETGRRYAGRSDAERREDRLERLLTAGLEVIGGSGWSAASVERVCTTAGVATRSFYEEVGSREALLLAVYERVMAGTLDAVAAALAGSGLDRSARIRAGITAYVGHLTEDPRRARVAHREVRVAGLLEQERHAAVRGFAALIEGEWRGTPAADRGAHDGRLLALALAGAVNELLTDWVETEPHPPTAPVVAELVHVLDAALS